MGSALSSLAASHPTAFNAIGGGMAGAFGGRQGAQAFSNYFKPREMEKQSMDVINSGPQSVPNLDQYLNPTTQFAPPSVGQTPNSLTSFNQDYLKKLFPQLYTGGVM